MHDNDASHDYSQVSVVNDSSGTWGAQTSWNGMNSQQAASDKLSNPSKHMEGCQELVESGTPTSVASSTR
ncbi:hypothetical protein PG999_004339 [Apiospora kogelbergensis]|uniref:Uncharacterized protein n=1 Tax=Apiospora kogelbergensis TaxID=1337665 RepID=A0AAW0QZ41_9PEZI